VTELRPGEDATMAAAMLELCRTTGDVAGAVRAMSQRIADAIRDVGSGVSAIPRQIDEALRGVTGGINDVGSAVRAMPKPAGAIPDMPRTARSEGLASHLIYLVAFAAVLVSWFLYDTNHYTNYLQYGDGEKYAALTYTVNAQNGAIARHDDIVDGPQRREDDHFLSGCIVVDPQNWRCATFDGQRLGSTINLVNGRYQPTAADGPLSETNDRGSSKSSG
jgi:hypothetical protein